MTLRFGTLPLLLPFACAVAADGESARPVEIVFDSDMHSDCDDVGALAVLHALADAGEARIVATIHTAPAPFGPACMDAINTYYGRGDVPIGGMIWPGYDTDPRYAHYRRSVAAIERAGSDYLEAVASASPRTVLTNGKAAPHAVEVYRRCLAAAADRSIVICAVGQLTALAALLESGPDALSPLSGRDLIQRKVKTFVTMAKGDWPEGMDTFNWHCDIPAAAQVLNDWPGVMAVIPHGDDILTGGRLVASAPADSPVRRTYEIYVKRPDHQRPSWDQCAVLYAVRGTGDLFGERRGQRIRFDGESGRHVWTADPDSTQIYVEQLVDSARLADVVEDLMCRPPKARR